MIVSTPQTETLQAIKGWFNQLWKDAQPAGEIKLYGGTTAPYGYFLCNGSAVSRTLYARLFSVIGTTYGAGDGSTTFNVPDLRGRFPLGLAASGTGSTLGGTGGALDHTHSVPAHYHEMGTGADFAVGAPSSAELIRNGTGGTGAEVPGGGSSYVRDATLNVSGKLGLVTGGVDGNAAMTSGGENPAFLAVNYIIKW